MDVSAEAPLVEDTKSGVTSTVGEDQIDNLPINGRRVDSFVLLTPAVTNDGEFGLLSFRGIAAGNAFLTDGNDTTNSFYNENAGRTRIGSQLSQDAVQEFQVLSNGFSAEFGRAMGGVINTVTKSGGNDMHGTGLLVLPQPHPGSGRPLLQRHQGSGMASHRRRQRRRRDQEGQALLLRQFRLHQPQFPGPEPHRQQYGHRPDRQLYSGFELRPHHGRRRPDAGAVRLPPSTFIQKQMNVLVPRTYNQELGFVKIDWRPTDRNTFSFDMNYMRWVSPHGIQTQAVLTSGNMLGNNGNSTVQDKYGKASWTSVVTNNAVNEVRFGWFKDRLSDPGASDLYPAETGPLYITVAGSTVGAAQAYPRTYPSENRYQIVDNYSWTTGAHSVKFGMDFQTTQDWTNQLFNGNGGYAYTNVARLREGFHGQHDGRQELHHASPRRSATRSRACAPATSTSTCRTPGRSPGRSPSATACATKRPGCRNRRSPIRIIRRRAASRREQELRAARQPVATRSTTAP